MKYPDCKITVGCQAPHLSQVAAGFSLLHAQGELRVRFGGVRSFRKEGLWEHNLALLAEFEDGTTVLYDVADGYEDMLRKDAVDEQLGRLDRCFKRSLNQMFHNKMKNRHKMRPLGLNYFVTCPNNFLREHGDSICRTAEDYMSHNTYPSYKGLFYTRLWESANMSGAIFQKLHPELTLQEAQEAAQAIHDQIAAMNALRIGCIRACREALGDRFLGGLADSPLARREAPDLLLQDASQPNFLRLLKENYVCLATEGLHRSIGWKMAEYTAAGRAICCTPPACTLPGVFKKGQNFAAFETPEECAQLLPQVLDNVPWIHRMEAANFAYYNRHVRPDAMVRWSLWDALGVLDDKF